MRNVMITTIGEDYVLAAPGKGPLDRRVMFTYAARNAILPNMPASRLAIGFVVAGALRHGDRLLLSRRRLLLLNAVTSNDFPLMQGIFLVITFAVLLANLLADIVYVVRRSARADEGGLLMAAACRSPPRPPRWPQTAPARPLAPDAAQGQGRRRPARCVRARSRSSGRRSRRTTRRYQNPDAEPVADRAVRAHLLGHHRERPGRALPAAGRDPADARARRCSSASSPRSCR